MGNAPSSACQEDMRTSISLRSLSAFLGKKSPKQEQTSDVSITQSYSVYNQNVFGTHLQSVFLPEFQFRSDICKSDFHLISKLGQGTFSTVYYCAWLKRGNITVALKVQSKQVITSKHAEMQITRETKIHKLLNGCPFIAEYYDCWQTMTHLFSVMEFVDGGRDLYDLWSETKQIPEAVIRIYSAEIGMALDYLRRNNVVNRDFKMENIALSKRRHIKLIDFGFARMLHGDEKATTICGTLQYMAPEVARGQPYAFSVDWWCFGVLLFILSESRYPYPNSGVSSHEKLQFDTVIEPINASRDLSHLVKKLLSIDPEMRLTSLEELQRQSFFPVSFSFTKVLDMEIQDFEEYDAGLHADNIKSSSIFSGWL